MLDIPTAAKSGPAVRKTAVHDVSDADVHGNAARRRPMRSHRKETAGGAEIRQRFSFAWGKYPCLHDARRYPDASRNEGAGRGDHGGILIDFGLLRHQARLALHHQYVGEHRQSLSLRYIFHIHPNCLLSGLVYIKVPSICGATIFASPRIHSKNIEPTYFKKNEFNADIFSIPPEKGRTSIWPSHVPHAVDKALPTKPRIGLSLPST